MRVLLIEDNLLTAQMMAGLLASRGLYVACAGSVAHAQGLAGRLAPPDALIVDFYLPDGTGLELLRQLRQRPGWEGLPAVLATAGDLDNIAGAVRPGDQPLRVLGKPFDVPEAVALLLAGRHTVRSGGG